jgi:acyl carrier protein
MCEADQNYSLKIIKMVIDTHLDKTTCVTKQGLQLLESNPDQVVWEVATKIYTQSGYKIDFHLVRNEVDTRIETIKAHLAAEEEARIAREEVEAEARRAREAAEEEARIAHKKSLYVHYSSVTKDPHVRVFIDETSSWVNGNETMAWLLMKIRAIVIENLDLGEDDTITLDTNLKKTLNIKPTQKSSFMSSFSFMDSSDIGLDSDFEFLELIMGIEEAFDVEIPDEAAEEIRTVGDVIHYLLGKEVQPSSDIEGKLALSCFTKIDVCAREQ